MSGTDRPRLRARARTQARRLLCTLAALAALGALAPSGAGAALDNAGTDFWVGFPTNFSGTTEQTLFITGAEATSGDVSIPGLAFTQAFSVTPGAVTTVALPAGTQMSDTGTEDKGVHITAGKEVVVYGLNRQRFTTDAFLGLPVDVLGTAYTVLGWGPGAGGTSEFSVVAPSDGTEVTITPSVDGEGGRTAGTPFVVNLNQGQQFQLQAATPNEDLTGTRITSNRGVAVMGGHQCANIPNSSTFACDHVVEQNPPEQAWGSSFLTVPLKTRQNGDTFQFVASQAGTEIRVNGTLVATLGPGESHEMLIDGQSQIQSTKPILVAQYSNGSTFDGVTSDPFEMHIPPFEQFQTGYTVTTPATGFASNFVNIIARDSAVGDIQVDGTAIPPGDFTPIGSSGFSGAQVDLSLGTHVLTGDGQPFGAFMYGFDSFDSYGYPGGSSLAPVAAVQGIAVSPPDAITLRGTEHCVTATLTDSGGARVPGVRVDFTVAGANPTSGSVTADSNGEARFCYTGNNLGEDTIQAAVGGISGTARNTWVAQLPQPVTPPAEPEPRTPARLRIHHQALVALRDGLIVVILRCRGEAGQQCAGTVSLKGTNRRSRLNKAGSTPRKRFTVRVGRPKRMAFRPTNQLDRLLDRRRKAIGSVTARVTSEGQTRTVNRLITIQPRAFNKK
jgi:hypothetical protein